MIIIVVLAILFVLSVVGAVISMKDFTLPQEVQKILPKTVRKGTIVFFGKKIRHYEVKRTRKS